MKDRWHYEMALRALDILQRQNRDVGGLCAPRVARPLTDAASLKDLVRYWADFFEDEMGGEQ